MKKIISLVALSMIFASCEKEDDQEGSIKIDRTEIKDFIWKGMNKYYLWQEEVPNLADNRFAPNVEQTTLANEEYSEFLAIRTAKNLFNELLEHGRDYYSSITTDYTRWESSFEGKVYSSGMEYIIFQHINREYYGIVTYVLPGSSAEREGVRRGHIFSKVDGERLTRTNQSKLLFNSNTSMTIDLNKLEVRAGVEVVTLERDNVVLTKTELTENPIFAKKIHDYGTQKVGYLMYNSFNSKFDTQLNDAFAEFKAAGVNEFVLDLRYNTGGEVQTAITLASMLTGQFTGQLFSKEIWNKKIEPEVIRTKGIINNFRDIFKTEDGTTHSINSLELETLYVLTSTSTASASELLINSLKPYINVVQIGETTRGKNQAAIEVYDEDANGVRNPRHKWAMLPMAVKHENNFGESDFHEGLYPDTPYSEDYGNLGVLGEASEPMLNLAILQIRGLSPELQETKPNKIISISSEHNIAKNGMRQSFK